MKHGLAFFLGIALTLIIFSHAPQVHANTNDFTVTSFTVDDTLSKADPQGELHVVERITVDFSDYNHGLLRAIPNSYMKHRLQLHVNQIASSTGAPTIYSAYTQNGNTVLKIGDPSRTVTGSQKYTIDYTVRNVISFYGDHDEFYWNINGDQWDQPFSDVRVTLHLPSDLKLSNQQPICYAGAFASQTHNCFLEQPAAHIIVSQTVAGLSPRQTLSVVVGFQKGYFHPSTWYETLGEYQQAIVAFFVPLLATGGVAFVFWFRLGRDPKGRGTIIPEYDAPDELSPIEVGTIIDFKTDNKDITATIIDLAIRRYLTIIEQTKDRTLRQNLTTYTLRLVNPDFSKLNEFESTVICSLFTSSEKGEEVDLSYMKYKFSSAATRLRALVRKSLVEHSYFRPSLFTTKRFFIGLGILAILLLATVSAGAFGSPTAWIAGLVCGVVIALFFFAQSASRTAKGVAAKDHIKGLKLYLKIAEADRIKKLQSPNAPYAPHAKEPERTVELFEKLLPYAMVLGVEQQWARQFESIYHTPPDWYNGDWNAFSIIYLTSSLSSGIGASVNSAFTTPSSSSGSGFGGGGAGGGGGGGGGW